MVFGQIVLLIIVSFLTCGGQICQKQAVDIWQAAQENAKRRGLYWLMLAVLLLGLGMLLWLRLLQVMPLNIAYPMLSINFVVVTLTAQFLYGERVTRKHWCGVAAIVTGVILMGAGH